VPQCLTPKMGAINLTGKLTSTLEVNTVTSQTPVTLRYQDNCKRRFLNSYTVNKHTDITKIVLVFGEYMKNSLYKSSLRALRR
jgi:hypothetical protein